MTQYSAQFGSDTLGNPPAGWTARWVTTNSTWAVQSAPTIEAGKNLRHTATATARRLLSLDAIDGDANRANVELLARFAFSSTSGNQGVFAFRASGAAAAENAYRVTLTATQIQLRKYLAGADSSVSSASFTPTAGRKYYCRAQANGTTLRVRIWDAATTEPGTWNISVTDANIAGAGWVGFAADTLTGNRDFDFLGAGTNGDAAPYPTDGSERPRVTQAALLTLDGTEAPAWLTQAAVLFLEGGEVPVGDARATQAAILILTAEEVGARVTQAAVLALVHETPCLQQLCQCWSIARQDGVTLRYTTHDEPVTLQGQVYQPCSSLMATATSGGAVSDTVGDVSVQGIFGAAEITARDMLGGLYDGAIVEVWAQQWGDAEQGFIPYRLARGIVGRTVPADVGYRMELLSPAARLMQRPLLIPHTPACRFDLGDGQCPVDLGPLTVTGSVTSLPARDALQRSEYRMFSDSTRAEADGYFADGRVTWTSGQNLGASCEVRTNASGAFTLWAPTAYPIEVGDAYSMAPGCNKTRDDHVTKFGLDMVSFGGWPDLPGNDLMTRTPDAKS